LRIVLRFATIRYWPRPKNARFKDGSNNRSKFNVPLGVEAQGFCVIR